MSPHQNHMRIAQRRGTALILFLAALGVFLVMAAFAVNVAYMQLVRTQLRAASDAAARAGAEALARTESADAAKQAAITVAAANTVGGSSLSLTTADISIGHARQLGNSGKWEFLDNQQPYSSVRINADQSTALMMFGITGRQSFRPVLTSTAAFSENEICLVIDRSHSMCFDHSGVDFAYPSGTPNPPPDRVIYPPHPTGSRWASLVSGVDVFLNAIASSNATQRVSLVTWASTITLADYEGELTGRESPETSLDRPLGLDNEEIRKLIASRSADVMLGGTNMSAGMVMGVDVLTGADSHDYASKIMIVMSDGKWNFGSDPKQTAMEAKKKKITIHTVSFLDSADQMELQKIAKTAGGLYFHASNTAELEEAFRTMARSLPVVLID